MMDITAINTSPFPSSTPPVPVPPPPDGSTLPTQPTATQKYAGFWIRVAASLLDGFILQLMSVPLGLIVGFISAFINPSNPEAFLRGLSLFMVIFLFVLYNTLFLVMKGATPGKIVVGIKVITATGDERISFGRALLRETLGRLLSAITLGGGYLMMLVNDKKQTLHDRIAKTIVVRTR